MSNLDRLVDQLYSDWDHDPNYYDNADSWVDIFWNKDSIFRRCFNRMDTSNILELACGRGRHTWQMRDWNNCKTMMDIVDNNIEFCIKRFDGYENVNVSRGNGVDLSSFHKDKFSSVFCYDAMVHFDHLIVYSYLKEIYRVLSPGGKALLHHSNYDQNPGGDYKQNPSWRAFMPPGLFIDYAIKTDLIVEEHITVPWGDVDRGDKLTLLCKPFD